jgi:uncharacterized lipoprotein
MAKSAPIPIDQPYDRVFETVLAVLPQNKMKVRSADQTTGVITARTAANLMSWGENITIRLSTPEAGATTTTMVIESTLRFGLARSFNAKKNFATITDATKAALGEGRNLERG